MRTNRAFVWTGRRVGAWPEGRDAWTSSRPRLVAELKAADVLVLIDAISFHYPMLAHRSAVPIVAVLPPEHGAETIEKVLGVPLLQVLGPFDRIITTCPDQRKHLSSVYDLPDEVWLECESTSWSDVLTAHLDDEGTRSRLALEKARWGERFETAQKEIHDGLFNTGFVGEPLGMPRRVALLGETDFWAGALERNLRAEVYPAEQAGLEDARGLPRPAPRAVAVAFRDGGQSSAERAELLRRAHDLLSPGGSLVVLAHVVDTEDGRSNPSIGRVVEEVHEATGHLVHIEELRSVRWSGDRMRRGAVLRFASLRQREE